MSWGGCLTGFLAAGCLLALSARRASLERRLLATEDCRVTLACLAAAADSLNGLSANGLPETDDDLTTTGLAFVLDGLPPTATAAPGALGAVGWTTVGRTGLGFWDGLGSMDGGFAIARPVLTLVVVPLPVVLPVVGWSAVLALSLTTLGRRGPLLAVAVLLVALALASLTGSGAGSLAGGEGFL